MPATTTGTRWSSSAHRAGRAPTGRAGGTRPKGRTSSAGQGRFARNAMTRTQGLVRRKPPKPTGMKRVTGVITAALPTAAAKKATPSSKKGAAGSIALLAAAAGMAIKNRDKLSRMTHRGGTDPVAAGMSESTDNTQANNTAMPPSTSSL
jgi:hypothetical protein